jgi:PTS system mannose-specific IIB component/fructoselysine and glucoselysine-specific PTS system IIB component
MPILLYRVDERLIHGQVVVGWGSKLHPDRYVVVDRTVAQSQWEQELYALGIPPGTEAIFCTAEEAGRQLDTWRESKLRTVLLTRDVETMLELAREDDLRGREVNLGGIHFRKGREEVLSYLYLDEQDREALRELAARGVHVSARDLPGSPEIDLDDLTG